MLASTLEIQPLPGYLITRHIESWALELDANSEGIPVSSRLLT